MTKNKCSHEENRKKVCAPCGKKIVFGKKNPNEFLINANSENLIKKFINSDFNINNSKFPLSICKTCHVTMLDYEKGVYKRPIQDFPNYVDLVLSKETRSMKNTCNCYICMTARFKGHAKNTKGRGKKRNIKNVIDISNGLYGHVLLQSNQSSDLKVINNTDPAQVSICNKCFQAVGRGIDHPCKNAKENILKLVEKLPENNKEQLLQ